MNIDQLIKCAQAAREKYGNIQVRVGGHNHHNGGLQAIDTTILTCEKKNELVDVANEEGENIFMIWDE